MKNKERIKILLSELYDLGFRDLNAIKALNFAEATLVDGTKISISNLEVGGEVTVLDADGIPAPVFDGEHKLENGSVVVTVDGIITEIKPAVEAEMAEDVAEDEIVADETADAIEQEMAEEVVVEAPIVDAPEDIKGYVDSKIDELLAIIAELKSEIESAKPEIEVEMKKKPASMADNFAAFKRFKK
jgi:hypothetical protein